MKVRAALLDANGVYLRMDTLADPDELTPLHLPAITSCDLAPGEYRWIADRQNQFGGAFWPLKWLARCERDRQAVLEAQEKAAEVEQLRALAPEQRRPARAAARAARVAANAAKAGE